MIDVCTCVFVFLCACVCVLMCDGKGLIDKVTSMVLLVHDFCFWSHTARRVWHSQGLAFVGVSVSVCPCVFGCSGVKDFVSICISAFVSVLLCVCARLLVTEFVYFTHVSLCTCSC